MDDKRTVLAIFISLMVVLIYSELVFSPGQYQNSYAPAPVQNNSSQSPTTAQSVQSPNLGLTGGTSATTTTPGAPSLTTLNEHKRIRIITPNHDILFNSLGGRVESLKLRNYYKTSDKKDLLDLVSHADGNPLPLAIKYGDQTDDSIPYEYAVNGTFTQIDENTFKINNGEDFKIQFQGIINTYPIIKTISIVGGEYIISIDVAITNSSSTPELSLDWTHYELTAQHDQRLDYRGFIVLSEDKVTRLPIDQLKDVPTHKFNSVNFAAFSDMYFMSALIPSPENHPGVVFKTGDTYTSRVSQMSNNASFKLFAGPKSFELLQTLPFNLYRSVDLGWFSFIAHPLLWLIKQLYKMFNNFGLAIVLLTLLVKWTFLPLTKKSFESMQAMQAVQPEVQALRERIKDPTQMNQEMLALYKKRGVNPLGGCLPMFIQLPVFLGLYNALLYSIELRHAHFALWITDLSIPERLPMFGVGIPVMVIIMGASMLVQQWMTPAVGDPTQRKIMMIMPLVFTGLFINFPAGLVLYWLVNNIISIVQQYAIKKAPDNANKITISASFAIFAFAYILTVL